MTIQVEDSIIDDGFDRWPDMYLGAEEYYDVKCSTYLTAENDTFIGANWVLPTGLTNLDSYNVADRAFVKIRADSVGTYFVMFELDSIESGKTQKTKKKIKIVVLASS